MKNNVLALFALLFLYFSCNKADDTIIPDSEKTNEPGYIKTIDFSSSVSDNSTLEDFDVENGYLYFISGVSIYRINLNSNSSTIEFIIEDDIDWPETLKVIDNTLYYQGAYSWAINQGIKQIDLGSISEGVQSTHNIIGVSRSQFCKNSDKLYYVSSNSTTSPTSNIYKFNPSSTDQLIATDEYIIPKNLRVIDQFIYFSSNNEIRKFDLNNPTEESSIVYTVPEQENEGNIIGFDIKNNVVYFTQVSSNKLFYKDLESTDEKPKVLKVNGNEGDTGYGKLIIYDENLYVKKIGDAQLEIFGI